jgi:hypothetical protein
MKKKQLHCRTAWHELFDFNCVEDNWPQLVCERCGNKRTPGKNKKMTQDLKKEDNELHFILNFPLRHILCKLGKYFNYHSLNSLEALLKL